MAYSKAELKKQRRWIIPLFKAVLSRKYIGQIFACSDFYCRFILITFICPSRFVTIPSSVRHCTVPWSYLNQRLSWSISVADEPPHGCPFFLKNTTNAEYVISSWCGTSKATLMIPNNVMYIWSEFWQQMWIRFCEKLVSVLRVFTNYKVFWWPSLRMVPWLTSSTLEVIYPYSKCN
jgi:hypothetical protein